MFYTVTLSPVLDYVIHTDALSEGVQRSKSEEIICGGKGIYPKHCPKACFVKLKPLLRMQRRQKKRSASAVKLQRKRS